MKNTDEDNIGSNKTQIEYKTLEQIIEGIPLVPNNESTTISSDPLKNEPPFKYRHMQNNNLLNTSDDNDDSTSTSTSISTGTSPPNEPSLFNLKTSNPYVLSARRTSENANSSYPHSLRTHRLESSRKNGLNIRSLSDIFGRRFEPGAYIKLP